MQLIIYLMIKGKSIAIKTEVKYVCYKKLYSNNNK